MKIVFVTGKCSLNRVAFGEWQVQNYLSFDQILFLPSIEKEDDDIGLEWV